MRSRGVFLVAVLLLALIGCSDTSELEQDVARLTARIGDLEDVLYDVGYLRGQVGYLKEDVGYLQEDVGYLQEDVEDDVEAVIYDVGYLQDDVDELIKELGCRREFSSLSCP
jgi:hypothetical protein